MKENSSLLCNNDSNVSVEVMYSKFKYEIITSPGVELSLWIILSLAVVFNIGVLIFRCQCWKRKRCGQMSPVSILLIALATSDLLLAIGKLLFLFMVRIAKNWCQEATKTMRHMCLVSFFASIIFSEITVLTFLVIAVMGCMQIVGCCVRTMTTKTAALVVLFEWVVAVMQVLTSFFGFNHSNFTSIATKLEERDLIDWHICWAYDTVPDTPAKTIRDALLVSWYSLITLAVGIFFSVAVVASYCRKDRRFLQSNSQIGVRFISVALSSVLLTLLQTSWDAMLVLKTKNLDVLLKQKDIKYFAVAATLSIPCVALANPLLLTVTTNACWNVIKDKILRCKCRHRRNTNSSELVRVETTRLFPDSESLPQSEHCSEDE